jgi:choline dehydrogenase-like flavoprotein
MFRAKALVAAARARRPAAAAVAALRVAPHAAELFREGFSTLARGNAPVLTPKNVFLTAHVEQIPDPDNRIMLSENRDRFGVPRPRLAWRINPAEVATLRAITDAAGSALRRRGFGDMSPLAWLDDPGAARKNLADTYHHAGATRMAETPRDGVVDPDCRVFGVDNLFVAGSSVFPTSGYANPTLTIVALAIRLAETLRRRFFAAG